MQKKATPLTVQQKRILKLVATARTNPEIAASLNISRSTVKRHMERILKKLKLRNRVEAALYAVRTGVQKTRAKGFRKSPA